MAIKRWNASTSQWELVGTPGTATPSAIGAATLASTGNTFLGVQTITSAAEWPLISRFTNPTSTHRNHILLQRSSNNAAVTSGFSLGGIAMSGHDGTNYGFGWNGGAEITAYASQTWTPSARGTSLAFSTTPDNTTAITERMRINSNGTSVFGGVVTGTAPSSAKVYVNNGSNENIGNATWGGSLVINEYSTSLNSNIGIEFKTRADSNGSGWRISSLANNPDFIFESRSGSATWTERMRIDSVGNVGIGTASPDVPLSILTSTLTVNKPALRISNTNTTGVFNWATSMMNSAMTTGQNLIQIMGKAESSRNSGYIGYRWVGDASTSNAITFGHFALDNVVNIDANGGLLVGYTSTNNAIYKLQVNSQIFATSSSIATSDGKYKENVLPITSGLDIIDSLNPVSFNWKEHPVHNFVEGKTVGFIAQEVQEALSEYDWADNIIKTNMTGAVLDEEGNEVTPAEEFLGIAESNIIPLLVAAVKELRAEVNALKAQLSN